MLRMFSGNFMKFHRVAILQTIDPNFRHAVKIEIKLFMKNEAGAFLFYF